MGIEPLIAKGEKEHEKSNEGGEEKVTVREKEEVRFKD